MENGMVEHSWPKDVGILAMDVYFPRLYVEQSELEEYDGVSTGKYTIGLGQTQMGFCSDREDIHSICLTVTQSLIDNYEIDVKTVGRLEVGTESMVDKSKSVKTVLMQLFKESGNADVEGVDTINACFGGTQAIFNAVNWLESSSCDGRNALVVFGDIAVYDQGPARCTGGAGAMALLLGPNAPLVFDRGVRTLSVSHVYDFFKPKLSCEYPTVDGKLSVQSYLSALDACYHLYSEKFRLHFGSDVRLSAFDAILFHSPYCKLVQKSVARLSLHDFLRDDKSPAPSSINGISESVECLRKYIDVPLQSTYFDRDLEKALIKYSAEVFNKLTEPSLKLSRNVGNMYTPSLYACLAAHLISKDHKDLPGCRFLLFSYGSGQASAMFSIRVPKYACLQHLQKICAVLSSAEDRLKRRTCVKPADFSAALKQREDLLGKASYQPQGLVNESSFFPQTYYLDYIDDKYRRTYKIA